MAVQQAAGPALRKRAGSGMVRQEAFTAFLFVAPALILIAAIAFFPIIQSIYYSLNNYLPTLPGSGSKFVGLDNYQSLFQDSDFTGSLKYTIIFMIISVFFEFILGLLFALVLNRKFPGRGFVRAAVLVPWAFPTVISAVVWRDLLWRNNTGAIPALSHWLHLTSADWAPLADKGTLLFAMLVIDIWKTAPFEALLLLAGLQVIPDDVYEAGRIDGAGVWQRFWFITLPLLKPAILVALLFRTLDAWRAFDVFFVVAGDRLQSVSSYSYKQLVVSTINFPVGVAASVIVFLGAAVISFVFIKGFGVKTAQ